MSAKIPDELKADLPQTKWGKVLVATPVVMTVVATLLAGLASSEMTRAQYDRSLAAQQQSKAGDQWSFFQAKRLRGALQLSTLDLLKGTTPVRPLDEASLKPLGELDAVTLAALLKGELPAAPSAAATDASVKAALEAVESMKPETEIRSHLAQVKDATLEEALRAARDRSAAFDTLLKPVNQAVDRVEKAVTAAAELRRDFTAARLRYAAARYDAEARLNQAIANLYELQVRKNNMSAERHHQRSGQFFYGMLTAQAAVVIATFSLAARQRNYLWGLAAAAGAAAVSFAIYVYLCM
ncbi:MAG TPA: hypothetical protein VI136_20980 [Verrucomicrobiae bacterium]